MLWRLRIIGYWWSIRIWRENWVSLRNWIRGPRRMGNVRRLWRRRFCLPKISIMRLIGFDDIYRIFFILILLINSFSLYFRAMSIIIYKVTNNWLKQCQTNPFTIAPVLPKQSTQPVSYHPFCKSSNKEKNISPLPPPYTPTSSTSALYNKNRKK